MSWLPVWHSFRRNVNSCPIIFFEIYSDTQSDIYPDVYSDMQCHMYSDRQTDKRSWHSSWHKRWDKFWHAFWHDLRHATLIAWVWVRAFVIWTYDAECARSGYKEKARTRGVRAGANSGKLSLGRAMRRRKDPLLDKCFTPLFVGFLYHLRWCRISSTVGMAGAKSRGADLTDGEQ